MSSRVRSIVRSRATHERSSRPRLNQLAGAAAMVPCRVEIVEERSIACMQRLQQAALTLDRVLT